MLAKEIKPGTIIKFNDAPHMIEGLSVQSPSARGGATLLQSLMGGLQSREPANWVVRVVGASGSERNSFSSAPRRPPLSAISAG